MDLEAIAAEKHEDRSGDPARHLALWPAVATRSFDRFVPAARRLRADWLRPVGAMGEAGTPDLAAQVYGAAIAGGVRHVDHLTGLCRRRTGLEPAPR